nr:hypothetical protein GCM10020093_085190 [Planobispora longispora]
MRVDGTKVYRILLVIAGLAGLVCTWWPAASPLNPPIYFTVQSNIMLVAYYVWLLWRGRPPRSSRAR